MLYSQSPPLAEQQWPSAEEVSSGALARDPDARSDWRFGRRRMKPANDSSYPYRFGEGQAKTGRPSIGRRIVRSLTRFSIAVLIGVGATLGWHSYGDAAKGMVVARAPMLAWLLSTSPTKSPVVAATSPGPLQQLEPLASNLDAVRRSVEQLAYKQEQIAQNIAALRAVEEDIRQKMSFAPPAPAPAPAQQAASIPQPKPPQPRAQSSAVQSSSAPRPSPPTGPLSR
ncbi:hypothetical protein J6524_28725 [Bradyrhizobium sp. WSM 1738]|uniref:hypothetical protein n=1 Tax=Bradyrhizobium hereditatis TaxID=2821405 RepID=UPI001CE39C26|nr:hypothetical protein [Bradyrhizobium hereditatis]MCA6118834.1 hypothetical protein [Bradyrhizobium hereditatis]